MPVTSRKIARLVRSCASAATRCAVARARRDSAWEALQSAQAQIVSLNAEIRAAEVALEGVRDEVSVGSRTVLDLLDQEQELLDAQVNRVRAQRDEVVASYRLLAAVGRLTAAELGLNVPIYDPEWDYEAVEDAWYGLSLPNE